MVLSLWWNQSVLQRYHSGAIARRILTFFFCRKRCCSSLSLFCVLLHEVQTSASSNYHSQQIATCPRFLSVSFKSYDLSPLSWESQQQQVNGLHHTIWGFLNVIFWWQGAYKYFYKAKLWSFPSKQSVFVNWLKFLNIESWRSIIDVSIRFCNIWKMVVPNIYHSLLHLWTCLPVPVHWRMQN